MTLATLQPLTSLWPYAHSSHLGFIGVGGGTFYLHHPLWGLIHTAVIWGLLGWGGAGKHSTYIIRFVVAHVRMALATLQVSLLSGLMSQQLFKVYWGGIGNIVLTSSALRPYAHRSHLSLLGWGGAGKHSTCIIRFVVAHVSMTLATLQAFTSFWPFAHSSYLRFIGVGGKHSTCIIRFEALFSQQGFIHLVSTLASNQPAPLEQVHSFGIKSTSSS